MFISFYKNNQGQLIPIFVVVLALLLIMVMITVNLGKLALFKTESSNAVDAGALASGSKMANVFNALARANVEMEFQYWRFFAKASAKFAIALRLLIEAYQKADQSYNFVLEARNNGCQDPCFMLGSMNNALNSLGETIRLMGEARETIEKIQKEEVKVYHDKQRNFYIDLKRMAKYGREDAIYLGHKLSFMNSGIGGKLKPSAREQFYSFISSRFGHPEEYPYTWQDGQGRSHTVTSKVKIEELNEFRLLAARNLYSEEDQLLQRMIDAIREIEAELTIVQAHYERAKIWLERACELYSICDWWNPFTYWACYAYPQHCEEAMQIIVQHIERHFQVLPLIRQLKSQIPLICNGLELDRGVKTDTTSPEWSPVKTEMDDWIIGRLEGVKPDYQYQAWVSQKQEHDKAKEPGLWQFDYAPVMSNSSVDFKGKGKIYPPQPEYIASIKEVDTEEKKKPGPGGPTP